MTLREFDKVTFQKLLILSRPGPSQPLVCFCVKGIFRVDLSVWMKKTFFYTGQSDWYGPVLFRASN